MYIHIIHTVHFFFDNNFFKTCVNYFSLKAADLNGKTAIVTGGRSLDGSSVEGKDVTFDKKIHETQICLCFWKGCFLVDSFLKFAYLVLVLF